MIYGYIRVSTDAQTTRNQRFEIVKYCQGSALSIDGWIEETISGVKSYDKRALGRLLKKVKKGYRLGDDIQSKVLAFAFGLSAEIERQLISQRTAEALRRKKEEGVRLGRPKGSRSKGNLLEREREAIAGLLACGAPQNGNREDVRRVPENLVQRAEGG